MGSGMKWHFLMMTHSLINREGRLYDLIEFIEKDLKLRNKFILNFN